MNEQLISEESIKSQEKVAELLSEVVEIPEPRGQFIIDREKIKEIIELPLVKAVQELYDKNIRTTESSANRQDIQYRKTAGIIIDFDTLSAENKEIAQRLCEVREHSDGYNCAHISMPVGESTTVLDIENGMETMVSQFKTQPLLWAPILTEAEFRKVFGIPEEAEINIAEFADYYYYDPASKLFYPSEEIFQKIKAAENIT